MTVEFPPNTSIGRNALAVLASLPLFEDLDLSRRLRKLGRARLVDDADIWVSARRWEAEGRIARTVKNWALTLAWMSGVSPEKLARHYAVRRPHDEVAA